MKNRPDYKLVLIEWMDSYTDNKSWHPLDDKIDKPAICISVGYLVSDKQEVKIIYPHIALEDEWTNEAGKGSIVIPSISIVGIKELQEAN
jgi:hypothetical protein